MKAKEEEEEEDEEDATSINLEGTTSFTIKIERKRIKTGFENTTQTLTKQIKELFQNTHVFS